jgi:hypothetical protein
MGELDESAKRFFAVKIINGKVPERVVGGPHDGLAYFEDEAIMPGRVLWITEFGLMDPEVLRRRTEHGES